jgi:outer membrane receptor protein involved in Fe transport
MIFNSLRVALLVSIAAPGLVAAQTAPADPPAAAGQSGTASSSADVPAEPAAAASEQVGGDIVVTGSRIARPDFAAPNPITSFNAAAIQQSGNTNITNFLQRVPALTGSRDSSQTAGGDALSLNPFGAAGLNQLNLRNLGVDRTLVLVDGRRHVAGAQNTASVDINSIPTDLIERVDVLTGTASAVYGADGVSGVVNFLLKRDFDGVRARAQMGISEQGDAGNRFASIAVGRNFADGRANVTLAYEYNADDRVPNDARRALRQDRRRYLIPNDADVGDNPNVPDNILVGDLRYSSESFLGAVDTNYVDLNGDGFPDFSPNFDGLGRPYDDGQPAAYYRTGGVSSPVAGFYSGDLFPRIRRHDANLLARFDVSDAFKIKIDGKFAQTRATSYDSINGTYGYPISVTNPFVPNAIRTAAVAAGSSAVYVNRDNADYPRHGENDLRRTYRSVVDVSGQLGDHATYDAYYTYGRTDVRITKLNDRLGDRYTAALDAAVNPATGRIECRSNFDATARAGITTFTPGANSGCIPVSLFGAGPTDPAAVDFFTIDDTSHARITQHVGSASVSGDFGQFFALPGGPVQFAFGGEYRREASSFDPSANLTNARFFQYDEPSLVTGNRGKFDVAEAFGELNVPIFQGARFAETLSVGAAGRYSHYSTVGNTKTWQFNGVYAPVRDLTFRGSYGKAVRAPNIGELFQPITGAAEFFIDPCTPAEIGNGTQYRQANCTASLATVGAAVSPGLQSSSFVNGTASGNPNLKAESARTWTAGVVLRPRFVSGLSVSVDWYDIKLRNAINRPPASQLATLCVDQPTLDNPFCDSITRARGTGIISSYALQPQNVASFRTAGADLNVDYLIRTAGIGTFDLRLVGGYLHRLEFIGIPGADIDNQRDLAGRPKWNANFSPTWTLGGLSVNYNLRWTDAVLIVDRNTLRANPDYAADIRYSELWQHDAQVQYQLDSGLALYGGVTNFTNQKPDEGNSTDQPISPLGRFFYVGAKVNLNR